MCRIRRNPRYGSPVSTSAGIQEWRGAVTVAVPVVLTGAVRARASAVRQVAALAGGADQPVARFGRPLGEGAGVIEARAGDSQDRRRGFDYAIPGRLPGRESTLCNRCGRVLKDIFTAQRILSVVNGAVVQSRVIQS